MYRLATAAAAVLAPLLLNACGDPARPTEPRLESQVAAGGGEQRRVSMMDACDPETFNAEVGEGTCIRNGGVTFQNFLSLLGKHQTIGAWHFAPSVLNVRVGQTLLAVNTGGEEHTFTEVEEFGGGIVPGLNALTGNPDPAPDRGCARSCTRGNEGRTRNDSAGDAAKPARLAGACSRRAAA